MDKRRQAEKTPDNSIKIHFEYKVFFFLTNKT